jgi:hypothetical protein
MMDALWPRELAYCYANSMPHQLSDPSGLQVMTPPMLTPPNVRCTPAGNNFVNQVCANCCNASCRAYCNGAASSYYDNCSLSGANPYKPIPPYGRWPGNWTPVPGIGVIPPPARSWPPNSGTSSNPIGSGGPAKPVFHLGLDGVAFEDCVLTGAVNGASPPYSVPLCFACCYKNYPTELAACSQQCRDTGKFINSGGSFPHYE